MAQPPQPALPYNLEKPLLRVELADELHEVSGLHPAPDGRNLLAVQDERGAVYLLNGKTMQIIQCIDFAPDGDFEGVTAVGDTLYAVKSTGTIYRIVYGGTPQQQTEKFKNSLTKQHNIEGLAADPAKRRLLLACKAAPPLQLQDEKHIFAIHLDDMRLDTVPLLRIRLADMVAFLEQNPALPRQDNMLEYLTRPEREGALRFSPSGIAIHPHTGHYYILSAAGRLLAVYAPGGSLLALHRFKKEMFEQPEGICFDARGTLYIAGEGGAGKAVIVAFSPI